MVKLTRDHSTPRPLTTAAGLIDGCGRRIDHLRLSVTPDCDLRCIYCRPGSMAAPPLDECGLSDARRVTLVRFFHERFGLSQVRLTGGEPLIYAGLVPLVTALRKSMPDLTIALTTNGQQLYHKGFELREAGLDRINVSVDSLDPVRYRKVTGGRLDQVLAGIESAEAVGFPAPKINTVVLRGVNDTQLADLTSWSLDRGLEIRFLEAMPIGPAATVNRRGFVSAAKIRETLSRQFTLEPMSHDPGATARRYLVSGNGQRGVIGIIAPVTEPFCADCRRIRLTSDGRLFPCLLDDRSVDMAPAWCEGEFNSERAAELIRSAVFAKPPQGHMQSTSMVTLGG